ncbi:MAG: hypothetical protein JWN23_969 [Rhodocyclales bacterium]|nr:hypothetical protein [Rhodocyclales bacterium]
MAFEHVRFMSEDQYPKFRGLAAAIGIPALLLSWAVSENIFMGIFAALIVLLVANLIWALRQGRRIRNAAEADWAKRGYRIDFQLGALVLDTRARKLAFLETQDGAYDIYDFSDIREWEHQWINDTRTEAGPMGRARSNTTQVQNKLAFKTTNPMKPLYKVSVSSYQAGEAWLARLSALFNG